MNIVFSSSDQYAECTGIALWSLYYYNRDIKDLNVYILSTDISDLNMGRLMETAARFHRSLSVIDAKQDFVNAAEKFHLPLMRGAYNTYSRIMLNTWFGKLDKILVIDSDTMVCESLKELWDMDLSGKLIAAVPELAMYGRSVHLEPEQLIEHIPMYYNMGICLVNLEEWRSQNIDQYLMKKIVEETEPYHIADQTIINKYLHEFIVRMPLRYNYYSTVHRVRYKTVRKIFDQKEVFSEEEFLEAGRHPAIIHYFGHSYERPWFKRNQAYMKRRYGRLRQHTLWGECEMPRWREGNHLVIRIYDRICYLLLAMRLYDFCLKFRYIYGQKVKQVMKISR